MREFQRVKERYPAIDDVELIRRVFSRGPFNRIPQEELDPIFARFKTPQEVEFFFRRHHRAYRHFFERGPGRGR